MSNPLQKLVSETEREAVHIPHRGHRQSTTGTALFMQSIQPKLLSKVLRYGPTPSASGTPASLPTFTPVYFTDFRRCLLLTEAFHNPRLYVRNADHQLGELFKVSTSHDADLAGKQIIVVRKVIDKAKVAWFLVLLLGISPVLGVVVGVCSHSAEAGIGVSAGVFALASFTQGIVAWIQG